MVDTKVMLNVDDPKLGEIAEVLGNKTAKKILGYLGEETASVSKISKNLKIALNTADYNVKKLKKVGLIEEKKHFWSDRGKRMPAYGVVNKEIVISPKRSALKGIVPAALVGLIGSGIIYMRQKANLFGDRVFEESAKMLTAGDTATLESAVGACVTCNAEPLWAWFLLGAVVVLVSLLVINYLGGFLKNEY